MCPWFTVSWLLVLVMTRVSNCWVDRIQVCYDLQWFAYPSYISLLDWHYHATVSDFLSQALTNITDFFHLNLQGFSNVHLPMGSRASELCLLLCRVFIWTKRQMEQDRKMLFTLLAFMKQWQWELNFEINTTDT